MILFWVKYAMFNINVNESQFALFLAKLKNLTSNQMKKNQIPTTFWRTLANIHMELYIDIKRKKIKESLTDTLFY